MYLYLILIVNIWFVFVHACVIRIFPSGQAAEEAKLLEGKHDVSSFIIIFIYIPFCVCVYNLL